MRDRSAIHLRPQLTDGVSSKELDEISQEVRVLRAARRFPWGGVCRGVIA